MNISPVKTPRPVNIEQFQALLTAPGGSDKAGRRCSQGETFHSQLRTEDIVTADAIALHYVKSVISLENYRFFLSE